LGLHSYDPGLSESEVVWSTEISESGVSFSLRDEAASLHVKDVLVFDTFTVPNSLDQHHPMGPKVKAIFNSLRIDWSGTIMRRSHTDCVDAFRGNFFEDSATIDVIATTFPIPASECPPRAAMPGFRFVSTKTTLVHFAQIGRERNGVFF
jgi:hypothetical protein